jgi:hypothetical protein
VLSTLDEVIGLAGVKKHMRGLHAQVRDQCVQQFVFCVWFTCLHSDSVPLEVRVMVCRWKCV